MSTSKAVQSWSRVAAMFIKKYKIQLKKNCGNIKDVRDESLLQLPSYTMDTDISIVA